MAASGCSRERLALPVTCRSRRPCCFFSHPARKKTAALHGAGFFAMVARLMKHSRLFLPLVCAFALLSINGSI
jgi:hypothetical protein